LYGISIYNGDEIDGGNKKGDEEDDVRGGYRFLA
jgi:hypothetical protein